MFDSTYRLLCPVLTVTLTVSLWACETHDHADDHPAADSAHHAHGDAGHHADAQGGEPEADTPAPSVDTPEPSEDGVDTYVAGLEKAGDVFTVRLVESQPVPKDTGIYTWIVELLNADGEPVTGATIVAEPTMPSHGHGTFPPTTEATELDEAGQYQLTDMDLFMPGVWQVELFIDHGDDSDGVVYNFDLEG